ncbi:hypothetical protein B0O99DRAFT_22430 [Bisporella sp. PMI_857]|nr:hypothetical protein B0O99DRAFT_22430 [Bisporella sp. PMI_857]
MPINKSSHHTHHMQQLHLYCSNQGNQIPIPKINTRVLPYSRSDMQPITPPLSPSSRGWDHGMDGSGRNFGFVEMGWFHPPLDPHQPQPTPRT